MFDKIIDRYNTYSIKFDPVSRGKPRDVLPMWVADMDFAVPSCVSEAIAERARHGIFGYSEPDGVYFDVVRGWFERRFGWRAEREWMAIVPGVVNALFLAVRAFAAPGEGVVIQQPVYYPFELAVRQTGRRLFVNELVLRDGRYEIDFDDFEDKVRQSKLFILCSPHNPAGRVWTREELVRMGEICLRHGVVVVSDEIHQDFVFDGYKHFMFCGLDRRFEDLCVVCTSPSKSFNLAGLLHSNIFIPNEGLRVKFRREFAACGLSQPGVMGLVACKAAYEGGEVWLGELVGYVEGNMRFLGEFLAERVPKVKLVVPEGTYLAWLDCRELGLGDAELEGLFVDKARLWLSPGGSFGAGGKGFMRMNAACPRSVLRDGLERLASVF